MKFTLNQELTYSGRFCSRRGSSILEMLLFTPLALFFLIAVTDLGIALKDRSAVIDSARSSLRTHTRHLGQLDSISSPDGLALEDHLMFLRSVADDIENSVTQSRGGRGATSPNKPFVRVALAKLSFNITTGQLTSVELENPDVVRNSQFQTSCKRTLESYLEQQKSLENNNASSNFALPSARNINAGSAKFLPSAYALVSQVCGKSDRFGGSISASMVGDIFNFSEEQFLPLRIQIGGIW